MRHELKVTFQPSGRSVHVLPGTILIEAAGLAGTILQTPCGGHGTCGKCRVRLAGKPPPPDPASVRGLTAEQAAAGWRLACQTRVETDLTVEIPPESTFESRQRILTDSAVATGSIDPVVRKVYFTLEPPSLQDNRSDLRRLLDAVGDVKVHHGILRALPRFLRQHAWRGTAVIAEDRLLALEGGDTTETCYGIAFDIGTTTIVGKLFDLLSGEERAVASRINPQVAMGDDVIARIMHARETAGGLDAMQSVMIECLDSLIRNLAEQADIDRDAVYEVVVAGNAVMQQILCGCDPSALGEVPFVQVFDKAQTLAAAPLGLQANLAAELHVFPQIAGFVGGDTVAGLVAARLDRWEHPVMLVDIGTNGEIVLAANGRLLATSTAAGPAFEGARIRQGMRATTGAIEKVVLNADVAINVIGDTRPAGLCGTALIDAAAELLRLGIIDETGRILEPDALPAALAPALRNRVVEREGEHHFVLVGETESATGEAILLWQRDVRELQLAVGAVRAGIQILMQRAGIEPEALDRILLAGGFGNFIRRKHARRIGLLPPIPCDRIRFIGNAAALGAKLALLSREERAYAERLRNRAEHIDLSRDADFQTAFGMAMIFPSDDGLPCE